MTVEEVNAQDLYDSLIFIVCKVAASDFEFDCAKRIKVKEAMNGLNTIIKQPTLWLTAAAPEQ